MTFRYKCGHTEQETDFCQICTFEAKIAALEKERDHWKEKSQTADALVACKEYSEDLLAQRAEKAESRLNRAMEVVEAVGPVVELWRDATNIGFRTVALIKAFDQFRAEEAK